MANSLGNWGLRREKDGKGFIIAQPPVQVNHGLELEFEFEHQFEHFNKHDKKHDEFV